MSERATVVVTGAGLATPLGLETEAVAARLMRGESGIGPFRTFDVSGLGFTAGAETPDVEIAGRMRFPKNEKFMGRSVRFAVHAAFDAVAASRIDLAAGDPFRVGLYTGSGQTGLESAEFFRGLEVAAEGGDTPDYRGLGGRAARAIDRYWSLRTLSNAGLGLLSMEIGAKGPSANFVQGDTASLQAVLAGADDLAEGRCDVVIAGGYDSLLSQSTVLAYAQAGLLSPAAPDEAGRPFDRRRDGLVLGEGAGFVVLEREADARRRGAPVLGRVLGIGSANETGDAPPKRSAETAGTAIAEATGGRRPDFVVAHGIGTRDGDRDEARLLAALGHGAPVTAFKGATGYLGAATGVVETILALMAARERRLPPVARCAAPDDGLGLDLVHGAARTIESAAPTALCLAWTWSGQVGAAFVGA